MTKKQVHDKFAIIEDILENKGADQVAIEIIQVDGISKRFDIHLGLMVKTNCTHLTIPHKPDSYSVPFNRILSIRICG